MASKRPMTKESREKMNLFNSRNTKLIRFLIKLVRE